MADDPEEQMFNRLWPARCTRCGARLAWVDEIGKVDCLDDRGHNLVHDETV